MRSAETNEDASVLALGALGWLMGEDTRASRFLSLTGLDPQTLRASLGNPSVLAAVLAHLEAHEPDLLACAEHLEVPAERLVAARHQLENT